MSIAVVIPTWDGWDLLEGCLESLSTQTRAADQVIVVDNGSIDGTQRQIRARFPQVQVERFETNTGFAAAVNAGIRASTTDAVVLLNNDAQADPGWLEALERAALTADSRVGFVTSKLLDADGAVIESVGDSIDRAGIAHQIGRGEPDDGRFEETRDVFSGCGGATLYQRSMLDDVGLFDERFFAYFEDVDLCFRAQLQGYRGVLAPDARVRHLGSATSTRVPGLKARMSARNGWWLVLKNVPAPLLGPTLARMAAVSAVRLAFAAKDDRAACAAAARGHLEAGRQLRGVLADRRVIQDKRVMPVSELRRQLPSPHLLLGGCRIALRALDRFTGARGRPAYNADAASRYLPVARRLGTAPGRVLELGSGNAGLSSYIDRDVVGLDFDFAATAELWSDRLARVRADAATLPVRSGSCDVVVSVDMLEHVTATEREAVLIEMLRVVRPGGRLLITFPGGRQAAAMDRRLDALWVSRTGRSNPWLAEHQALGLPDPVAVRRQLLSAGASSVRVHEQASAPIWLLVHRATLCGLTSYRFSQLLGLLLRAAPAVRPYRVLLEVTR